MITSLSAFGPAIFSDDLSSAIRREYNELLAYGEEPKEAERLILEYYSAGLGIGRPEEDVFWFALALSECNRGRLSEKVKEKALEALASGRNLKLWEQAVDSKLYEKRKKILEDFHATLLLPQQPKKIKRRRPRCCPWEVGSLLAYQIMTYEHYANHPCFKKYVLLRIVENKKFPSSNIRPDKCYDELMVVGLYDWIGDEIPDPEIVKELNYTYISIRSPLLSPSNVDYSPMAQLSIEGQMHVLAALRHLYKGQVETCTMLNWTSRRGNHEMFTCLGVDKSFQEKTPEYFDTSILHCAISHPQAFDITLCHKFEDRVKDAQNNT